MGFNVNNVQHNFAERIKELRMEAGLSQGALAEKLGVSRGSISFYENCDRIPDITFLVSASSFFRVSPDYLLGLSDVPAFDKDQKLSAACEVTGLSYEAISQIIDLKDNSGYIGLLSALLESPLFAEAMDKVYAALSCKQSAAKRVRDSWPENLRAIMDTKLLEDKIGQDALRAFSRYSDDFAIVPRLGLSESFLQTAQEKFKGAALEAIEKVESNHSMDEILLQVAKMELSAFAGNGEESGGIDNG